MGAAVINIVTRLIAALAAAILALWGRHAAMGNGENSTKETPEPTPQATSSSIAAKSGEPQ